MAFSSPSPAFLDKVGAGSSESTLSSDSTKVPRIRILLAPYMSPFVVPLNKVQTWELLIVMLQRLFGPTFCSACSPPTISHPDGRNIIRSDWYEMVEEDLTIIVHTAAADPPPRPTPTVEEHSSWLSPVRDETPLPTISSMLQAAAKEEKVDKVLLGSRNAGNKKKKKHGIWGAVLSVFHSEKPVPPRKVHVASMQRPQSRKQKKNVVVPQKQLGLQRDRREEKRKRRSITELPAPPVSKRPPPLKLVHSNGASTPRIPKRPDISVGVHANYKCLDEQTVRAVVAKRASDEVTLVTKSSQEKLKPRTSSATTLVGEKRPSTSLSARADGFIRQQTPYDNKPLPKLPYKMSLFPQPAPNTPTIFGSPKNGIMPPIASFEDLVKNTQSFSEIGSDWSQTKHKTSGSKSGIFAPRRKESHGFAHAEDKKDWFRRPHTRDGSVTVGIVA